MWKEYYNVYYSGIKAFGFPLGGLVLFIIGIFLIKYTKKGDLKLPLPFLYIWATFAGIWFTVAMLSVGIRYFDVISTMNNKHYKVVEGYVENFDPMPHSGHKTESFTVNNTKFEYSDYIVNVGFNNTKSHGGPIDQGKYVRIYYDNGIILKLWIKEPKR